MPEAATISADVRGRALARPEARTNLTTSSGKVDAHRAEEAAQLHSTVHNLRELSDAAKSAEASRQMTRGKGESAIRKDILGVTGFDKNGKPLFIDGVTDGARDRANRASEGDRFTRKAVEAGKGLEGLDSLERDFVQQQMESALRSSNHAAFFESLDVAGKAAMINELLTNPKALNAIRMRHGTVMSEVLEEHVSAARQNVEVTTARLAAAERRRDLVMSQLTGADRAQDLLKSGMDPKTRIAELEGSRPEDRAEYKLKGVTRDMEEIRGRLHAYIGNRTQNEAAITLLEGQLKSLRDQRTILEADESELNTLKESSNTLKESSKERATRYDQLRREAIDMDEKLVEANANHRAAEGVLDKATADRNDAESIWVSEVRNVIKDGMLMHLEAEDDAVARVQAEHLTQIIKDRKGQVDEYMANYLRSEINISRRPTRWNSSTVTFNKAAVRDLMRDFVNPSKDKGPIPILQKALDSSRPPLTDEQKKAYLADPKFVNHWASDYGVQIATAYMRTGGRITADMSTYIKNQPWGDELVQKAVDRNKPLKDEETALKEKGVLGPGGFKDYFKKHKKSLGAGALAGILMGIITGIPGLTSDVVTSRRTP